MLGEMGSENLDVEGKMAEIGIMASLKTHLACFTI